MLGRAPSPVGVIPARSTSVWITAGTIVAVLLLGGCAAGTAGGQSEETAEAGLRAIEGVSDASVNTRSSVSGFKTETSTAIEISVDAGYSVSDPEALMEYLVQVAWSTGSKEANFRIAVDVVTDPQLSVVDVLDVGGWESAAGTSKHPERALVAVDEVRNRLGNWPGDVPELPDGLIAGSEASAD
jgi:hypothetical protein